MTDAFSFYTEATRQVGVNRRLRVRHEPQQQTKSVIVNSMTAVLLILNQLAVREHTVIIQ